MSVDRRGFFVGLAAVALAPLAKWLPVADVEPTIVAAAGSECFRCNFPDVGEWYIVSIEGCDDVPPCSLDGDYYATVEPI